MINTFFVILSILSIVSTPNMDSIKGIAGDNADSITYFLQQLHNSEYKEWGYFLLNNMPETDIINLSSNYYFSYFESLNKNKQRVKWHKRINKYLFYNYILPYRVAQEPIDNFTSIYADTLFDIVKNCKNMKQAAKRINEWVYTKMEYKPTRRWDQNAITTIKRGIGRCEEMAILFIKALRSVSIPARMAYTPWWSFTNSNHAWVEVWADGKWYYMGGGELTDLNNTWFSNSTKKTGIVLSPVFSKINSNNELIYKSNESYTIINSTPNYTKTKRIIIKVIDNNKNVEDANVSLCVYNYASLRSIAEKRTNTDGAVVFNINPIDFFIYVNKDNRFAYKILNAPYKDTIIINLESDTLIDNSFWLYIKRIKNNEKKNLYKPNYDSLNLIRQLHFNSIKCIDSLLIDMFYDENDKKLIDILYKSRGNYKTLSQFYRGLTPLLKDVFLQLFDVLSDKDKVGIDTIGLRDELVAINRAIELCGVNNDSIIKFYLVDNRIGYERYAHYRSVLYNTFSYLMDKNIDKTVNNVKMWVKENINITNNNDYFAELKNPIDVYISKSANEFELNIFIVGILRSLGIPSKVYWDRQSFEYYKNGFKRESIDLLDSKSNDYSTLYLKFFNQDKDITEDMEYYNNFTLCKFEENISSIEADIKFENNYIVIDNLIKGDYWLINGFRNPFGDSYIRMNKVSLNALCETLSFEGGIPLKDIKPGMLLTREYKEGDLSVVGLDNSILKKGKVLMLFLDINSEASKSTLNSMIDIINSFDGKVLLFLQSDNKEHCEEFMNNYKLDIGYYMFDKDDMKKLNIYTLPTTILLEDNKAILFVEGLFLHLEI